MQRDNDPRGQGTPLPISRFRELVDAYGSRPHRWPEAEREPALALLAASEEAKRICAAAQALDELLDEDPPVVASPALVARILSTAPGVQVALPTRSRERGAVVAGRARVLPMPRRAGWRYAAVSMPLAAAALVLLWFTWPQATPTAMQFATEDLGRYAAPSDVLLEGMMLDVADSVPGMGCGESGLGCLATDEDAQLDSHRIEHGRSLV